MAHYGRVLFSVLAVNLQSEFHGNRLLWGCAALLSLSELLQLPWPVCPLAGLLKTQVEAGPSRVFCAVFFTSPNLPTHVPRHETYNSLRQSFDAREVWSVDCVAHG